MSDGAVCLRKIKVKKKENKGEDSLADKKINERTEEQRQTCVDQREHILKVCDWEEIFFVVPKEQISLRYKEKRLKGVIEETNLEWMN